MCVLFVKLIALHFFFLFRFFLPSFLSPYSNPFPCQAAMTWAWSSGGATTGRRCGTSGPSPSPSAQPFTTPQDGPTLLACKRKTYFCYVRSIVKALDSLGQFWAWHFFLFGYGFDNVWVIGAYSLYTHCKFSSLGSVHRTALMPQSKPCPKARQIKRLFLPSQCCLSFRNVVGSC